MNMQSGPGIFQSFGHFSVRTCHEYSDHSIFGIVVADDFRLRVVLVELLEAVKLGGVDAEFRQYGCDLGS